MKNAAIIIIGNEVLSGDVQDSNGNYLAKELAKIGIYVRQLRIIADNESEIIDHVSELRTKFDYLFVTGGIGPTHDDITTSSIAKAFGKKLYLDQNTANHIKNHYKDSSQERIDAAMKMAYFPEDCKLIYNPISQVPGFSLENTYIMAGVPNIMRAMFDDIKSRLKGGKIIEVKSIIFESGESLIASKLAKLQERFANVEIGSYPFLNLEKKEWHSNLVLKSTDLVALNDAYDELSELIRNIS
jgi:molybdenum cofactor synthesis domain-containing protein